MTWRGVYKDTPSSTFVGAKIRMQQGYPETDFCVTAQADELVPILWR